MSETRASQPWTRLPGLFRRFELAEATAGLQQVRIEPAGQQDCGVDLYAVYARDDLFDRSCRDERLDVVRCDSPSNLQCPRCLATAEEFEIVRGYSTNKALAICMVCNWETEVER